MDRSYHETGRRCTLVLLVFLVGDDDLHATLKLSRDRFHDRVEVAIDGLVDVTEVVAEVLEPVICLLEKSEFLHACMVSRCSICFTVTFTNRSLRTVFSRMTKHRTGKNSFMGWQRDTPDHRDHVFAAPRPETTPLPSSVDLTAKCPPIYDQGSLGSCTANAIGAAYQFDQRRQGLLDFVPSRLFIYYNERAMEGTVGQDAGAQIRDGFKSIARQGVCSETTLLSYHFHGFSFQRVRNHTLHDRLDQAVLSESIEFPLQNIPRSVRSALSPFFSSRCPSTRYRALMITYAMGMHSHDHC